MSEDVTEVPRRELVAEINRDPGSRVALEEKYGEVFDTSELQESFEVLGFLAPFVHVQRKSDGAKGSMMFKHAPRFYFKFEADGT